MRKAIIGLIIVCFYSSLYAVEFITPNKEIGKRLLPLGEKLTYNIRWMGIPAGKATIEIREIVKVNGHPCYRIVCRTWSNPLISIFYKVDDTIETYIDCEKFIPRRFLKNLNEGSHHRYEYIEFFHEKGKAVLYRKQPNGAFLVEKEMKIKPDTQDAFSCLFRFRLYKNIKIGDIIYMDVNADKKNWKLIINILDEDKIRVWGYGKFDTWKVKPVANFEGIFLKKGEMTIWLDKETGIPLRMKVDIPIGSVGVTLSKVENRQFGRPVVHPPRNREKRK